MWPFRKKTVSDALIDEIKSEPLKMGNLMGSIKNMNQLESLSKELSATIHPDRFVGDVRMQEKAKELFQKVQASRYNYDALMVLKQEIECLLSKTKSI